MAKTIEKEYEFITKKAEKELEELLRDETPIKVYEDRFLLDEHNLRIQILLSAITSSNTIYKLSKNNETSKGRWRIFFIIFCCVLLIVSLIFVFFMIYLQSIEKIVFSTSALVAVFTYIIVNLFSILFFMVKYVHNDKYLETFRTVTHKLLDYLLEDKKNFNFDSEKTD